MAGFAKVAAETCCAGASRRGSRSQLRKQSHAAACAPSAAHELPPQIGGGAATSRLGDGVEEVGDPVVMIKVREVKLGIRRERREAKERAHVPNPTVCAARHVRASGARSRTGGAGEHACDIARVPRPSAYAAPLPATAAPQCSHARASSCALHLLGCRPAARFRRTCWQRAVVTLSHRPPRHLCRARRLRPRTRLRSDRSRRPAQRQRCPRRPASSRRGGSRGTRLLVRNWT